MIKFPLLELSDSEYRELKAIHYSQIKEYITEGFSSLFKDKEETSSNKSLNFGSMVDILVTRPEDFESTFSINTESIKPQELEILDYIYAKSDKEDVISNIPIWVIEAASNIYPSNWKSQTRMDKVYKLLEEKYDTYIKNVDKILISKEDYNDALQCSSLIKNIINSIVSSTSNNYEVYYQAKLYLDLPDGIKYKCMFDVLMVDYYNKTILPIDIKTTSKPEYDFPKTYLYYKYNIQADLYTDMLKQVIDTNAEFKDYIIKPFTFIVINRVSQTPMIWLHSHLEELVDYKQYAKNIDTIFKNNLKYPINVSDVKPNSIKEYLIDNNLIN